MLAVHPIRYEFLAVRARECHDLRADGVNGQHSSRTDHPHNTATFVAPVLTHPKGRLRPLRGFKTPAGARVLCAGHAFLRNLRGGFDDLGWLVETTTSSPVPPVVRAWDALTGALLAR